MTYRSLSLVLVVLGFSAGCHSWQSRDISTGVAPAVAGQDDVRLTRADRSRIRVRGPQIVGDSLIAQTDRDARPVSMPVSDVRRVETRRFSTGRTALVVGSVFAFMLVFSDR